MPWHCGGTVVGSGTIRTTQVDRPPLSTTPKRQRRPLLQQRRGLLQGAQPQVPVLTQGPVRQELELELEQVLEQLLQVLRLHTLLWMSTEILNPRLPVRQFRQARPFIIWMLVTLKARCHTRGGRCVPLLCVCPVMNPQVVTVATDCVRRLSKGTSSCLRLPSPQWRLSTRSWLRRPLLTMA